MMITVIKNSSVLLILSCQKQLKKSQWATMRTTLVILRQSQLQNRTCNKRTVPFFFAFGYLCGFAPFILRIFSLDQCMIDCSGSKSLMEGIKRSRVKRLRQSFFTTRFIRLPADLTVSKRPEISYQIEIHLAVVNHVKYLLFSFVKLVET